MSGQCDYCGSLSGYQHQEGCPHGETLAEQVIRMDPDGEAAKGIEVERGDCDYCGSRDGTRHEGGCIMEIEWEDCPASEEGDPIDVGYTSHYEEPIVVGRPLTPDDAVKVDQGSAIEAQAGFALLADYNHMKHLLRAVRAFAEAWVLQRSQHGNAINSASIDLVETYRCYEDELKRVRGD